MDKTRYTDHLKFRIELFLKLNFRAELAMPVVDESVVQWDVLMGDQLDRFLRRRRSDDRRYCIQFWVRITDDLIQNRFRDQFLGFLD